MTEHLGSRAKIIAISGPDGGGKGFLTSEAIKRLDLVEVPMVTTRPSRGVSETKVPLDKLAYEALLNQGELIGHHENKGNFYAFRLGDFEKLDKHAIIELNPQFQENIPDELAKKEIELVGWIGLYGEPKYLETNIISRSKKDSGVIPDAKTIEAKLDMADTIMKKLRNMEKDGVVTLFKVGWDNRDTMGAEVTQLISDMLSRKDS